MKELLVERIDCPPLGPISIVCDEARVCALAFSDHEATIERDLRMRYGAYRLRPADDPAGAAAALRAYLAGDHAALDAVPVDLGGTPFQRAVWSELRLIPPGTTISYSALARRIGRPSATRAVGLANGANPVAIIVPCHRVIGADGTLTGYGGGLHRKSWLLAHEQGPQAQLALTLEV